MTFKEIRDLFVEAVEKHDYRLVPVTKRYRATENNFPAALCHMTTFRTINKIKAIPYYLEDPVKNTLFFASVADEGTNEVIFLCRLKIEGDKVSEVEIVITRSRGDSGFWWVPGDMYKNQLAFTLPLDKSRKADYEELEMIGRAVFDANINPDIKSNANCVLMESGGIVFESPAYIRALNPMFVSDEPTRLIREPIPFGIHPGKPDDPNGRVLAVDVEQGLAVVAIDVDGFVSPYVVPDETSTVFAPSTLIEAHREAMSGGVLDTDNTLIETPASAITYTIVRYQKGELLGIHQFSLTEAPGARSPWEL